MKIIPVIPAEAGIQHPPMKKLKGLLAVFAFFFLLHFPFSAHACSVCKAALLNSPEGRHLAQSFNHGILFLLGMTYLLLAAIGFLIFRTILIRDRSI